MSSTQLTNQQAVPALTAVCAGRSLLKTLNISLTNLSSVEAGLLVRAVNSLEEVNISNTKLTQLHTNEILTAVCADGSPLKTLRIRSNRLSSVEARLLARAVRSLEQVNLSDTELSRQQAE